MNSGFRLEADTFGELQVPNNKYYGITNFYKLTFFSSILIRKVH